MRCLRSRKPIGFRQWVVHKYSPEYLLSHECLYHNPKVFFSFYRQKMDSKNIQPNITHQVLAKLEECGKLSAIVTQNIDGLHQKAGSKKVLEINVPVILTWSVTSRKGCVVKNHVIKEKGYPVPIVSRTIRRQKIGISMQQRIYWKKD